MLLRWIIVLQIVFEKTNVRMLCMTFRD